MIINEENTKATKKPNASNITHGLAQLGGGSKAEGGGGMMGGLEEIGKKFYELGAKDALADKQPSGGRLGKKK